MFGWLNSKSRKRRKKVELDRKHLAQRTRRFLAGYLEANETSESLTFIVLSRMLARNVTQPN